MLSNNWTASTTRRGGWLILDSIVVAVSIIIGLYISAEVVESSLSLKLTPVKTLAIYFVVCCWLVAVSADYRKAFRRWQGYRDDLKRFVVVAILSTVSLFLLFYAIPYKSLQTSLHDALWPSLVVLVSLSVFRGIEHLAMRWRYEGTTVLFVEIDPRWYDSLTEIRACLVDDWRMSVVALKQRHDKAIGLPADVEIWDEARFSKWLSLDIAKKQKCLVVLGENQPKTKMHEDLIRKIYGTPIPMTNMVDFYEEVLEKTPLFEDVTSWHSSIGLPKPSLVDLTMKRAMDIAVAVPLLVLATPVMFLLGIMIRLESKGSAIFRQKRGGYRGVEFTMYKLRTMTEHQDDSHVWPAPEAHKAKEHHVTKLGGFLRRTGLDELPQLINVLKGDMSMIGPRPRRTAVLKRFEERLPYFSVQNSVKPGISGWASLHSGEDVDEASIFEKTRYNLYYAKYFSFWLDLLIYIRTFSRLIVGKKPQSLYVAASNQNENKRKTINAVAPQPVVNSQSIGEQHAT